MRRLILGTAGHIDHGKTALVKHLTGIDTDRLKEEKERGITVDLGFAELVTSDGTHFGVVDVPGHEGFIRNMVAGATGMDLVLMVVAADEGIMPQTREHLSIVRLLGVPRIVVALTKADLVEEEWLELVTEDVRMLLEETPYREAPILPVSAVTGQGIPELLDSLMSVGAQGDTKAAGDLARLPIDRVFTIRGTGTVVTGTLWTGTLALEDRVRILPGSLEGRVRSLQLHGQEAKEASAGARVAVGLTGSGVHHQTLTRGQALVQGPGWEPSWMLTCRISVLPDTGWDLEQGQRVRVHIGTAEVLARVALLQEARVGGGEEAWVQLRLEEPVLARAKDHLVLRAYSPVTTIGGGRIVEVVPPKRKKLGPRDTQLLEALLKGGSGPSLAACLEQAAWAGVPLDAIPHRLGLSPGQVAAGAEALVGEGRALKVDEDLYSPLPLEDGEGLIRSTLSAFHTGSPLLSGMPLQELRQAFPGGAGPRITEFVITHMVEDGRILLEKGLVRLSEFSPRLTTEQEKTRQSLADALKEAGLSPPSLEELAASLGKEARELESILRLMEREGEVLGLDGGLFFETSSVAGSGARIVAELGGRSGLGPADFRDVLGVSRKYLLPLLRYMDTAGVTTRLAEDRTVAGELPKGWGTSGGRES